MTFSLEPIFDYEMTVLQAKAYKLGLMWLVLSRKHFPNYRHTKSYPKTGDPRDSALFRYCYKAVRETQGLIADEEYKLYIKAQLDVLRAIDLGGKLHPRIEPNVLAGDKAWIRWKIWKRKYDKIVKGGVAKEEKEVRLDVVVKELKATQLFLESRFEGGLTEEAIQMGCRDVERWVHLGKVSGYYAVLSPWVQKYCKNLTIDKELYKVTPEITDYFHKQFSKEYIVS